MPILDLQRQFRELGRIRLGEQRPGRNGRMAPAKLDTFRLTSPNRELLDRAADIYRGEVKAWTGQDRDAWQLTTEVSELDIIVPPGSTLSQWNEMWGGGGCIRRCDSAREWIGGTPCLCPADPADRNELAAKGEACKPTTRLSVALPSLPDLGTWLLVSHGYYAAVELAGTYELLAASSDHGRMIPAILGIDHRTIKRQGQARKDIIVPVIRLPDTITELMGAPERPAIAAPAERLALPAPEPLPEAAAIVVPFTREDLLRRTQAAGIDLDAAASVQRRLFPAGGELTDDDRRALWAEVAKLALTEIVEPPDDLPLLGEAETVPMGLAS